MTKSNDFFKANIFYPVDHGIIYERIDMFDNHVASALVHSNFD